MTLDEVKQIPMKEIAEQYGFRPSRAGFIHCPFHVGDRDASMKLYERDYHCFACGAHGDQLDFVQRIDNLSFREAFLLLGGTYEEPTYHSKMAIYHSRKERETRSREGKKQLQIKRNNLAFISKLRKQAEDNAPFSDGWCEAMNALPYALYIHGILNEIPY